MLARHVAGEVSVQPRNARVNALASAYPSTPAISVIGISEGVTSSAFRGMLIYNALITAFLGYLGAFEHVGGLLLWPGFGFHALVTVLLVLSRPNAPAVPR